MWGLHSQLWLFQKPGQFLNSAYPSFCLLCFVENLLIISLHLVVICTRVLVHSNIRPCVCTKLIPTITRVITPPRWSWALPGQARWHSLTPALPLLTLRAHLPIVIPTTVWLYPPWPRICMLPSPASSLPLCPPSYLTWPCSNDNCKIGTYCGWDALALPEASHFPHGNQQCSSKAPLARQNTL